MPGRERPLDAGRSNLSHFRQHSGRSGSADGTAALRRPLWYSHGVTSESDSARIAEINQLAEACRAGDIARTLQLLQSHGEVLDSPDRDTRFIYAASCLWSPLGISAMQGHEQLVNILLEMGANPVP